jgi:hypothetical protein
MKHDFPSSFDPTAPVISQEKGILSQFESLARSVVWQRTLSPPVQDAVDRLLHERKHRRFIRKLDNLYLSVSVIDGKVLLSNISRPSWRTIGSFSQLFANRNADALIEDIEARVLDVADLLSSSCPTMKFYTCMGRFSRKFHTDFSPAIALNYGGPRTQYGPPHAFKPCRAGGNPHYFKCIDESLLTSLPAGSVSILHEELPHRSPVSIWGGLRLFAGMVP